MAVLRDWLAASGRVRSVFICALILPYLAACANDANEIASASSEAAELFDTNTPQDDIETSAITDLFLNVDDPNTTIEVNRYLWNASLDVLNFLPLQNADPFTGIIVTGFGTPPGGNQAYRATIYVRDPALDARSLSVALATRSGPAPTETVRAVEDAIMTRARQLRIQELNL